VAEHHTLFDGTLGTAQGHNLRGANKRAAIEADAAQRGFAQWGYAGNSRDDLPVWAGATEAIAVNTPAGVLRQLQQQHPQALVLPGLQTSVGTWLRAIRIKQWAKNALLFLPLLAAHSLQWQDWTQVLIAFFAFGLCASATYLFNDLMDLPNDRLHRIKRHRPLAAGAVGIGQAVALGAVMMLLAFVLAALVSGAFAASLLVYTVLTLAYTLWLKRLALIDVLLLSALYTLRIAAGAVAGEVELSNWLLAISIFLFLSLALVKRCAELEEARHEVAQPAPGRGYHPKDLASLRGMGMSSGFLAVMVLALYVDSQNGRELYAEPQWLWAAAPLLLFWIMRMWLKTGRRELHGEDPLQFAMKDGVSWITLLLMGCVGLAATVGLGA
jgi:4-hydroxybenzoate polyprenyltransferase